MTTRSALMPDMFRRRLVADHPPSTAADADPALARAHWSPVRGFVLAVLIAGLMWLGVVAAFIL